jgi:hypothetical protein
LTDPKNPSRLGREALLALVKWVEKRNGQHISNKSLEMANDSCSTATTIDRETRKNGIKSTELFETKGDC